MDTEMNKLIFGVSLAGETAYSGRLDSEYRKARGLILPASGGAVLVREGTDRKDDPDVTVGQYVLPVDHAPSADSPLTIQTTSDPVVLTRAGAYIVYGESGSGKSSLLKSLAAIDGREGVYLSIGEPDGLGYMGNASMYSLAMHWVASQTGLYIIDSLMAASIYGEALAEGGLAKSVFLLAGQFDVAARRSKSICLLVLNPLVDLSDGSKGNAAIRRMAMATTQGIIMTTGVTFRGQFDDTGSEDDNLLMHISANYNLRPERQDRMSAPFVVDQSTLNEADHWRRLARLENPPPLNILSSASDEEDSDNNL